MWVETFAGLRMKQFERLLKVVRERGGDVVPVGFVAGHPGGGDLGVQCGDDHLLGRLGLRRELKVLRDSSRVAVFEIRAPGAIGRGEPAVDRGPSTTGGQGEEHADLRIFDASRGPVYCRCTPAEDWPFPRKPASSTTRTPPSAPRCSAA